MGSQVVIVPGTTSTTYSRHRTQQSLRQVSHDPRNPSQQQHVNQMEVKECSVYAGQSA